MTANRIIQRTGLGTSNRLAGNCALLLCAGELLLSTAPAWVGPDPEAGGDGGPLPRPQPGTQGAGTGREVASAARKEAVAQGWRDHWKQCWCPLALNGAGAGGLQVREASDQVAVLWGGRWMLGQKMDAARQA